MKAHNKLANKSGAGSRPSVTERQILRFAKQLEEDTMTQREAIYTRYEKFEEELAHCYFLLHERFIADPPLAGFWADAAMDELQHFSLLRFCRERGLVGDVEPAASTTRKIEDLLETVKGIVSDPSVSVEEAFYASLLMESSELDEMFQRLTDSLQRDHPLLYQAVHANLQSHFRAFTKGAERFCKDRGFIEAFRNLEGSAS